MKAKLLFISILVTHALYCQQYLLLDELEKEYTIKKYTLNTKKMYNIDGNIEMYNMFVKNFRADDNDVCIYLFSILPDLNTGITWQKIHNIDSLNTKIISIKEFENNFENKKYFNDFQLIKYEKNTYFVSENCLLESFLFVNYPAYFHISGKYIVNIGQQITTPYDIRKFYNKERKYPMEDSSVYMDNYLKSIYLSKIQEEKGKKIYRFWTFDDWYKGDCSHCYSKKNKEKEDYSYHRGIDRFAYIEGKGIVGGSYDFYFDMVDYYYCIRKVVKHDIMWAKELFPERQ